MFRLLRGVSAVALQGQTVTLEVSHPDRFIWRTVRHLNRTAFVMEPCHAKLEPTASST